MSNESRTTPSQIPALDGLRAFAVVSVVVFHAAAAARASNAHWFFEATRFGWAGVDLFFVLSGFLITRGLLAAQHAQNYFQVFYARRSLRIFPLYYVALLGLSVIVFAKSRPDSPMRDAIYWSWPYLSNIQFALVDAIPSYVGHFWSLAVEEQFYLLWPLVVGFASRRSVLWVAAVGIILAVVFRVGWIAQGGGPVGAYALLPARMDALLMGAFVAGVLNSAGPVQLSKALRRFVPWGAAVGLAGTALAFFQAGTMESMAGATPQFGYSFVALFFTAALVWTLGLEPNSFWERTLCHPSLRSIGRYSYGIYVIHYPLNAALRDLSLPERIVSSLGDHLGMFTYVTVLCLVSYGLAYLSFHLLEKHFLQLKKRANYRFETTDAHSTTLSERACTTD